MNTSLGKFYRTLNAMTFTKVNLESPYSVIKRPWKSIALKLSVYFSRVAQFSAIFDA